ncbi:hypothetical protein BGW36DRAFT_361475 [Talaromyces proteolyticus]|uniref:F-box domain-containing protein n=1 Tax=Talaromyces proteolyticus TaxID=1131652 RepID=A0AAD4PVK6_9EURO|nr:uncharacterized protein BGW36DRAFT_361475 [Talaromyces proteolyticus]KAH8693622.1 hypothetical protein BGW36DRAFT_361475 [Talaromyces proteolyticus]
MGLLDLPTELLLLIALFLTSKTDINSLCRASSSCYAILNSYLYRHNHRNGQSSALKWAAEYGNEGIEFENYKHSKRFLKLGLVSLASAAEHGHEAVAKLLLKYGNMDVISLINEDQRGLVSETERIWENAPLFFATMYRHEAVVKLLLENTNAKVNIRPFNGKRCCTKLHSMGMQQL